MTGPFTWRCQIGPCKASGTCDTHAEAADALDAHCHTCPYRYKENRT